MTCSEVSVWCSQITRLPSPPPNLASKELIVGGMPQVGVLPLVVVDAVNGAPISFELYVPLRTGLGLCSFLHPSPVNALMCLFRTSLRKELQRNCSSAVKRVLSAFHSYSLFLKNLALCYSAFI